MAENRWRYNQGLAPYLFLLATLYALSAGQCIYYARILDDGPRVCVKDPKGINEWWCRSGEDALLLLDEAARTAHHSVPRYFYTKYNVIIWNMLTITVVDSLIGISALAVPTVVKRGAGSVPQGASKALMKEELRVHLLVGEFLIFFGSVLHACLAVFFQFYFTAATENSLPYEGADIMKLSLTGLVMLAGVGFRTMQKLKTGKMTSRKAKKEEAEEGVRAEARLEDSLEGPGKGSGGELSKVDSKLRSNSGDLGLDKEVEAVGSNRSDKGYEALLGSAEDSEGGGDNNHDDDDDDDDDDNFSQTDDEDEDDQDADAVVRSDWNSLGLSAEEMSSLGTN